MTKNISRQLHRWLALPLGVIISLICFSGATLVFEHEILRLVHPERYTVAVQNAPRMSARQIAQAVAPTLDEGVTITEVTLYADPRSTATVSLSRPRRAAVFVDPYTGTVVGNNDRGAFFMTMFRLHRWLLEGFKPGAFSLGKTVVGISTMAFVFVLISGLFIWWPRTIKALKQRLRIATDKGKQRLMFDLHAVGGVYASVFLLVMALTGLTWSFDWYRSGFYKVFGAELMADDHSHGPRAKEQGRNGQHPEQGRGAHRTTEKRGDGARAAQQDHDRRKESGRTHRGPTNSPHGHQGESLHAASELPTPVPASAAQWEAAEKQIRPQAKAYHRMTFSDGKVDVAYQRWGNQRAADTYYFDATTGKLNRADLYADRNNGEKIRGWIYSVHVGSWGGVFTRILQFVAALIGGTLPLTGYYLWWRKFVRKRNRSLTRS